MGKLYALFGIFMCNFPRKQSNWFRLKPFTNDDTLIPSHSIWDISHGSSGLRKDNQVGANLMLYCLIYWMLLDLMWKHHAYMHMLNTVSYSFRTLLYRKQEVAHISKVYVYSNTILQVYPKSLCVFSTRKIITCKLWFNSRYWLTPWNPLLAGSFLCYLKPIEL